MRAAVAAEWRALASAPLVVLAASRLSGASSPAVFGKAREYTPPASTAAGQEMAVFVTSDTGKP
jgi:hypothetical protein